jgi:D-alanyl-D-alanine carboxypeptidase (penicillin-binding protein 5/6)
LARRVPAALLAGLALVAGESLAQRVPAPGEAPVDAFPRAATAYLLAIDEREIWARAADVPRAPASLTKLLTALVVLGGDSDPDGDVLVSARAAAATGSRLGLRAGERLGAADVLTAMLVASANDACVALAEHAAGSVEAFVTRMDLAATLLGLARSRFGGPCGLDAPGQAATPRDLLRLARAAMRQPAIAGRVGLAEARIATRAGRVFRLRNSNALIGRVAGAVGVKSGFTAHAGKCVIAAVDYRGQRLWLVLLDGSDRWWAATGILEAARDVVDEGL